MEGMAALNRQRLKESAGRSFTKSVTFRVIVIVSDLVVIYFITHAVVTTVALTIYTNLASTLLYFLHERAWNLSSWGRRAEK